MNSSDDWITLRPFSLCDFWKAHLDPAVFLCRHLQVVQTSWSDEEAPSVAYAPHRPLRLFSERTQDCACIPPLAVLRVELVLVNVVYHRVREQVFHAPPSSQGAAHLGGAGVVPHPLPHQVDVPRVARQPVWLVHRSLGLKAPTAHADEAEAADHLLHVVVSPHARDLESIQKVCSAQELQLWGRFGGRKEAVSEQNQSASTEQSWNYSWLTYIFRYIWLNEEECSLTVQWNANDDGNAVTYWWADTSGSK